MADFMRFRTALGGFNREDVSDYIEKLSRDCSEKLRAMDKECSALRDELAERSMRQDALAAKVEHLHELFGELEQTFRAIDEEYPDANK